MTLRRRRNDPMLIIEESVGSETNSGIQIWREVRTQFYWEINLKEGKARRMDEVGPMLLRN